MTARAPSLRRFDVLGGPGGYLSARHVGAMRPGEYVASWTRLVRVNVPRRLRYSPRAVYLDVLRHYRAQGCAV
jgi:hypothetical protein